MTTDRWSRDAQRRGLVVYTSAMGTLSTPLPSCAKLTRGDKNGYGYRCVSKDGVSFVDFHRTMSDWLNSFPKGAIVKSAVHTFDAMPVFYFTTHR